MKKKVLLIFGSRPDCIKLAPIFFELKKSLIFNPLVCAGAQSNELLMQTLNDFKITPDYNSLSTMPTNQAIIIAVYNKTRSIIVTDSTIDLLFKLPLSAKERFCVFFAPTALAKERLLTRKMNAPIYVTGSTEIDSLQWAFDNGILDNQMSPKPILIAAQQREGLQNICAAALELAKENRVIFILPPDPKAHSAALEYLFDTAIELIELPPYSRYISLARQSQLILTDSEDLQEIGPALDIPVLVLRDKTEYPEGVIAGAARLVGTDQRSIVHNVKCLLHNQEKYDIMVKAKNPYGDGRAAHRIIKIMEEKY